jgi:extradiol dioxygenase family protein
MTTTTSKAKIKGTYGTMYYVKDMKKETAFFKEKLGLKPGYESADWTEFPLNGHSLCLHPVEGKKDVPANGSLIIHVDGLKELVADLKA